jgi:isopentenyldiphosphate isomerase
MVEDPSGRILLQKRTADQPVYPNAWDNSAAGHVDAGESYETAAARELAEEIGLKDFKLHLVGSYRTDRKLGSFRLNRFNRVYRVIVAPDTTFTLQEEEVAAVKWFSATEVKRIIKEHPEQVTDGVLDVFERFY